MKTVILSATFDGEHIRLEEDHPLPQNARLLVTLLPESVESESAEWREVATQNLASAYGGDEPDYPDSFLKERNPLYDGR